MTTLTALAGILGQQAAVSGSFDPESDIAWHSLMYAEDSVTTKPSDLTDVRYWSDPFDGGADFFDASSNAARWPTYHAANAAMNSKPALVFDTIEGFASGGSLPHAISPPFSIMAIYTATSNTVAAGTPNQTAETHASGLAIRNPTYRNSGLVAPDYTTPHIYVWVTDGASSRVAIDGGTPTTMASSPGTADATKFLIASIYGFANRPVALCGLFDGDLIADGGYASFVSAAKTYYGI